MMASRRWPWAVGALVAATIALLVASLLRGAGGPPVIRVADSGTNDRAMSGEAAPAMDGDLTGDLMWYPWVEFVLADGARFGAGEATGWRMDAPDGLRAAATRLAEHFGVDTSSMREAPYGGEWMAGPEDGSAPSLWMEASGSWHVSDPTGQPMVRCIEAEPHEGDASLPPDDLDRAPEDSSTGADGEGSDGDAGGTADSEASDGVAPDRGFVTVDACEPVEPPANVPTEAEARDLATALFADLGLFATPRIEYVHADEWGAWVEAALPIDGMATDIRASVGFGAEGRVTWASGTLARAVDVGQYPTVDAEAAVARLQNQSGHGGGVMPLPAMDAAEAGDAPVSDRDDAGSTGDAIAPADPMPRPAPDDMEVRQVTLVAFEPTLLVTWDADGTWWLLPGVRFTDADGGIWQVLIVADEYLDMGHDAVDPSTAPEEPAPVPEPLPPADEAAQSVIGIAEADATDRLVAMGYEVRVVARDGESFAVTDDHRTDRVNLEIKDGIVAHAYGG